MEKEGSTSQKEGMTSCDVLPRRQRGSTARLRDMGPDVQSSMKQLPNGYVSVIGGWEHWCLGVVVVSVVDS